MSSAAGTRRKRRLSLRIRGVVQGVGFRPFVYRLARRLDLAGSVRNTSGDVEIDVEGRTADLERFLRDLRRDAPPLARVEHIERTERRPRGRRAFAILTSTSRRGARQPITPDAALCAACERELYDPGNRRHRYPFITCTDCGPRFTIIEGMPYDRARTSMRRFAQCPDCRREYTAPGSRRYRSETNSCPTCGPRVWMEEPGAVHGAPDRDAPSGRAVARAASLLRAGRILAVRGLGGFHLAVDATDETAVSRLRARKGRETKPLAVMVRSVAQARALGLVGPIEAELLRSRERPIVLLRRLRASPLAPSVAPGLDTVGVMTAYTPLHHLLLEAAGRPLVMTSGNRTEEPIAVGNDEARRRLADIADGFLLHDREIVARYDDSVVRVADGTALLLRRARGYAPLPLQLPTPTPIPLLAAGAHLKNTFALAHRGTAYVSQHIGDLEDLATLEHFTQTLAAYRRLFEVTPRVAVCDMHPGYLSTRFAEDLGLERVIAVQHHHAHVAAVVGEHAVRGRVVGIAYDGTGYGADGRIWGAELLAVDADAYVRMGQLRYAPLPGGDLAAREGWRAALGYLSLEPALEQAFAAAFAGISEPARALVAQQLCGGLNAPLASSMGRLFDAAAAILGVRRTSSYEGQAAMELEALAGRRTAGALPFPIRDGPGGRWVLDPLPLLAALGERRAAGHGLPALAAQFHESVAAATAALAERACAACGANTVALGGGVFQNVRLLESVVRRLRARRLTPLVSRRLSPNDGCISYGQAVVGAARLAREGA